MQLHLTVQNHSSNITVGTNSGTNSDGDNYIMYCFRKYTSYSKSSKI